VFHIVNMYNTFFRENDSIYNNFTPEAFVERSVFTNTHGCLLDNNIPICIYGYEVWPVAYTHTLIQRHMHTRTQILHNIRTYICIHRERCCKPRGKPIFRIPKWLLVLGFCIMRTQYIYIYINI